MKEKRYPVKEDLDKVESEKPVALFRNCFHCVVLNSKALQVCGIDANTKVSGGLVEKDEQGNLNGVLRENALNLVYTHLQERSERKKWIEKGLQICMEMGLTCLQTNDSPKGNKLGFLFEI